MRECSETDDEDEDYDAELDSDNEWDQEWGEDEESWSDWDWDESWGELEAADVQVAVKCNRFAIFPEAKLIEVGVRKVSTRRGTVAKKARASIHFVPTKPSHLSEHLLLEHQIKRTHIDIASTSRTPAADISNLNNSEHKSMSNWIDKQLFLN